MDSDTEVDPLDTFLSKLDDRDLRGFNEPMDTFAYGIKAAVINKKASKL